MMGKCVNNQNDKLILYAPFRKGREIEGSVGSERRIKNSGMCNEREYKS